MADLMGFDANNEKPNEGFDPVPAGEYDVVIVKTDGDTTDNGKFRRIKLEMQILNGPQQNRKLFDRLNIAKAPGYTGPWGEGDQKALTIGRGNLSSLCRAVNVLTPKDSDELKAKPFRVKVTVKKSEEYGAQNNIAAYKPRTVQPGFSPPSAPLSPVAPSPDGTQPAAGNWPPPNPFG